MVKKIEKVVKNLEIIEMLCNKDDLFYIFKIDISKNMLPSLKHKITANKGYKDDLYIEFIDKKYILNYSKRYIFDITDLVISKKLINYIVNVKYMRYTPVDYSILIKANKFRFN